MTAMGITGLNHANVITNDMPRSVAFYEKLGFTVGERPAAFPDPGIWMYLDRAAVIHLNHGVPAAHGVFDHVGLNVRGSIPIVTDWLKTLGIRYDLWEPIPGAHRALYFHGPSGEKIELVFTDEPKAPL